MATCVLPLTAPAAAVTTAVPIVSGVLKTALTIPPLVTAWFGETVPREVVITTGVPSVTAAPARLRTVTVTGTVLPHIAGLLAATWTCAARAAAKTLLPPCCAQSTGS
jgi:hypothetical protein